MIQPWSALTRLTRGESLVIERVRLTESGVAVEGAFQAPVLASLSQEDQLFVAAFVQSHGSIKRMERLFGISYPTVKNRLNRIAAALGFPEVEVEVDGERPESEERRGIIRRLESGEISVEEAIHRLERT